MDKIFPEKLKAGDEVRIITPSRSLGIISPESIEIANKRFEELGLKLSFGKRVREIDDFASSSIESRIEDLHEAFSDKKVKAIFTAIGINFLFNTSYAVPAMVWLWFSALALT